MRANTTLIAVAALLALLGCKSKESPAASASEKSSGDEAPVAIASPVHKTGNGTVSATIGSGGGTLELTGGPRVTIPPGAVQGTQDFVLKEAPKTTAFFNSEHERPAGPTFIFAPGVEAPEGSSIKVSIHVNVPEGWGKPSLAYEYAVGEMVGAEDSEHTKWQYEDAELQGGTVEADLPALNGYRLQFVMTNLEAQ